MNPEDDRVIWDKKLFKKIGWWTLGIFVVLMAWFWIYGTYGDQIDGYFEAQRQKAAYEKYFAEKNRLESLKQADNIGGKTPEETLDMFISALKENNPEKASKFYTVSEQEKQLASLKEEIKNKGNLALSINYFTEVKEKGKKTCSSENSCGFNYSRIETEASTSTMQVGKQTIILVSPAGSESRTFVDLSLNLYTKIWKIVQP